MYIQRVVLGDRQVSAYIYVFVVWFAFPLFSFSHPPLVLSSFGVAAVVSVEVT